jgi:hypothetical protein
MTATLDPTLPPATVSIASITSPSRPHLAARLSKDPLHNCAGVVAIAALRALGVRSHAVSIHLTKGLPLGWGLGSSVAALLQGNAGLIGSHGQERQASAGITRQAPAGLSLQAPAGVTCQAPAGLSLQAPAEAIAWPGAESPRRGIAASPAGVSL